MSEPYDLRSNIKGKPGSQGTLFQVKDKGLLNPAQRWPQGYTPERLNEVRGALKDTEVKTHAGPGSAPLRSWEHLDREHLAKTIAPSTVPASDLAGLRRVDDRHEPGHEASYYTASKRIGWGLDGNGPKGLPKGTAAKNLIHEIGHHVDQVRSEHAETMEGTTRNRLPSIARTQAKKDWQARGKSGFPNESAVANAAKTVSYGAHEGYADNYYTEHYRAPGRKRQGDSVGRYEEKLTPQHLDEHYPGYTTVRPQPHMGPQFDQPVLMNRDQARFGPREGQ